MEQNTKAIILNTREYKEADKLATIFSRDLGKICVRFVGVAKPKAKLKANAQPFSYSDLELMRTGDFFKVKTAKLNNSFAEIVTDFDAMKVGYAILETLDKVLPNAEPEPEIFDLVLDTLNALNDSANNKQKILIDFWLKFTFLLGNPIISADADGGYKYVYLDGVDGIITPVHTHDSVAVDGAVWQTICGTGIRVSELQYITVEAVKQGEAVVNCKAKTRSVFIVKELKQKLLRYAAEQNIKSGMIFATRTGKPISRTNIWREMKALCVEANVNPEKVFPHNLRHLFARVFYGIEKDIAKLADILGHSSINTTRIYIISTGTEHRQRMENMRLII